MTAFNPLRDGQDIELLYEKWLEFLDFIKVDLYDYESELAYELLKLPLYADITQTRQSGKSFVLGLLAFFLEQYLGWHIIIGAPKTEQTGRIMEITTTTADWLKFNKGFKFPVSSVTKLRTSNGGTVRCISGDPFTQVEGHKAHVVILDEKHALNKDHIASKIIPFRGFFNGLIWSLGIGGEPDSWGETSRKKSGNEGNLVWECPWQRVIIDKPEYEEIAMDAKDLMLPPEFAAHYECQPLDMSEHILIPEIKSYTELPKGTPRITVYLDFGKLDKTIATVVHKYKFPHRTDKSKPDEDYFYIHEWNMLSGDYAKQRLKLTNWLQNVVRWHDIIGERNGVGEVAIDELNAGGIPVMPLYIGQTEKNKMAQNMRKLASEGRLLYNSRHNLAKVFYNNITNLKYKMTAVDHVKVDHSDFYSSLGLAMIPKPIIRIS